MFFETQLSKSNKMFTGAWLDLFQIKYHWYNWGSDTQVGPGKNEGFGVSYSGKLAGISDP